MTSNARNLLKKSSKFARAYGSNQNTNSFSTVRNKITTTTASKSTRAYHNNNKTNITLTVNDRTGIATLELRKPPANTLSFGMLNQLASAIQQAETDKYSGLILTSAVEGIFSTGLDLRELHKPDPDRILNYFRRLQDLWFHLYDCSTPTVAMINGCSIHAGGCLIALSCEYRLMMRGFHIGMNETVVGLPVFPMLIATMRGVLGLRETERALLEGKLFTSEEALEVGLVDEVVESEQGGLERAEAFLEGFGGIGGRVRGVTKRSLRLEVLRKVAKRREEEARCLVEFISTKGCQEVLRKRLDRMSDSG